MKRIFFFLFFSSLIVSQSLYAQLEKVVVETYYVSDVNDASDTIGGHLEAGSTTYRIYVDMKPGSKLKSVYGDADHALKISSTRHFYNNKDRGVTFGKDLSTNRLTENTVALDTWLTLGQASKSPTYFGVLKTHDDSTNSVIGGINNDGGSAGIALGLLSNSISAIGIPLTKADGIVTTSNAISNWLDFGIGNPSIFNSEVVDSQFVSNNARIGSSGGVSGTDPLINEVLIAQLTTIGTLTFELNLEIVDQNGNTIKYVANNNVLNTGEKLSRYLNYYADGFHLICGCPDPNYIDYNDDRDCDNNDSCITVAVLGCLDPLSCNYNPNANVSDGLCCYPGSCQDRDPAEVCQIILGIVDPTVGFEFDLFPNPAQEQLNIKVTSYKNKEAHYEVYDYSGKLLLKKSMGVVSGSVSNQIEVSNLVSGLYLVRLYMGDSSITKKFVKE